MPHLVIIRRRDRAVVVLDPPVVSGQVTLPEGDDYDVVQIADVELAKFSQQGMTFKLDAQNAVVAAPPPPPPPLDPGQQEQATSRSELMDAYTTAMARLDDIATNGGSYTGAQVRDAVVDLAVMMRRLARATRALLL